MSMSFLKKVNISCFIPFLNVSSSSVPTESYLCESRGIEEGLKFFLIFFYFQYFYSSKVHLYKCSNYHFFLCSFEKVFAFLKGTSIGQQN